MEKLLKSHKDYCLTKLDQLETILATMGDIEEEDDHSPLTTRDSSFSSPISLNKYGGALECKLKNNRWVMCRRKER